MSVSKRVDALLGLAMIVLSAYVYYEAAAMPGARRGVGPGTYPKFAAIGLLVLGAILVVQTLLAWETKREVLFSVGGKAIARVVFFCALIFVYTQIIRPLGFILASTLFQLVVIPFFGYRRPLLTVLFSVAVPSAIFVIFRYVFLVLIPTGTIFG